MSMLMMMTMTMVAVVLHFIAISMADYTEARAAGDSAASRAGARR